ncbi:MAG: hypothetical protein GVY08_08910 [Bacteroidetes bacterium]|nr:hypothetical protein [Bacteroidota bacterium]
MSNTEILTSLENSRFIGSRAFSVADDNALPIVSVITVDSLQSILELSLLSILILNILILSLS